MLPTYAARGLKLRGEVKQIEVETTTVIDLIRAFGAPDYLKVDIEGADLLCLHGLFDSDLPRHLSIERPRSFSDQMFALELMRRLGYRRFAFVEQQAEHDSSSARRAVGGASGEEIAQGSWTGWLGAAIKNAWIFGVWAIAGAARRAPLIKAAAPGFHWYDIHAVLGKQTRRRARCRPLV
jgi:hypothetical protein